MIRKLSGPLTFLLAIAVASRSQGACPQLTGRWGYGPVHAVAAAGTHAYYGSGSVLMIADLTNPASVSVVGHVLLADHIRGVTVSGTHVYVAANQAGLRVVDVSNPAAPAEVGHVDTDSYAVGVTVSGHYLYLADGWDGLRIFDVADPTSLVEVGSFDTPTFARDVAVAGGTAYIVDFYDGLFVANVGDPAHPAPLGALALPGDSYGVSVLGSRVLVAGTSGLRVVDVSNQAAPAEIAALAPSCGVTTFDVAVAGSYAYLASVGCGLTVVNVSNPASPVETATVLTPGSAQGVAVSGPLAVVANDSGGLSIVDVATPSAPALTFTVGTPDQTADIAIDGDHAFLAASSSGLRVLAIDDPANPAEVASLPISGSVSAITIRDHLAYLWANNGGLRIVDVTNPMSPVLRGSVDVAGSAYDIALSGGHAYIFNGAQGFRVFDVSDPDSPALAATLPLPGATGWRLAVAGNHAFVTDTSAGLRVIDVTSPTAPAAVAVLPVSGGAQSVAVAGTLAYVGNTGNMVYVVDVSNPASPVLVAPVSEYLSNPADLAAANGFLFVANGDSGISILSIAVPTHPELVGTADTPGQTRGFAIAAGLIGVADLYLGAAFFDFSACPSTLCSLSCSAAATPAVGLAPLGVRFTADSVASSCGDGRSFEWDFGDGSPHATEQNPTHTYAATGTYPWTVVASVGFHLTACSGTVVVAAPPPRHFDFGTPTSPVAAGYTRVSHNTSFSGSAGFGWSHGVLGSRDRGAGPDLTRDFVFSPDAGFGLLLPSGDYDVTVTMGDAGARHDQMALLLEGRQVDTVSTTAGQFATRSQRVSVADGALDVTLDDLGGADANAVVNALVVTNAAPFRFDFGTPTSPVASGYVRVTHSTAFEERRGYGWLSGTIGSRDRVTGTSLSRDFAFTPLGTFVVDLANGTYDVVVTIGDKTAAHDQMGVLLEGVLVDTVSTPAGTVKNPQYRVQVNDGQLTLTLDDLGGGDPNVVINALEIYGGPTGAPGTVPSVDVPKDIEDHETATSAIESGGLLRYDHRRQRYRRHRAHLRCRHPRGSGRPRQHPRRVVRGRRLRGRRLCGDDPR